MQNFVEGVLGNHFSDPRVQEFVRNALELSSRKSNPVLNYFGLNYTPEKILNVKFYVAFFHRLQPEEIGLLLPDPSDLNEYYHDWQESESINNNHS